MSHPFADVWEAVADAHPGSMATIHGSRRSTWAAFDQKADDVGRYLLDAGAGRGDKFAQYLFNGPEYLESVYAAFKIGCVPVNTNYRYTDDELVYLWDNADAVAVVYDAHFDDLVERVRSRLPGVHTWFRVGASGSPAPDWATSYEDIPRAPGRTTAPWGRSGDDVFLLYTGGTTGMPKGVMWRQADLFSMLSASSMTLHYPPDASIDEVRDLVAAAPPGQTHLAASPLMHGTGALSSFSALNTHGRVVTLTGRQLDVTELLDTIERERVTSMAIVGDAFAKPMRRALDREPDRWDITSLRVIVSSGVMWSADTKEGLLRHHPAMVLADSLASSEAIGIGSSTSGGGAAVSRTAAFVLGSRTRLLGEDGRWIAPGSGEPGLLALRGPHPLGYYKDDAKTAATFRTIDGERYAVPGDWAVEEADGSLTLLGRGSACINTGGEKVFPEEVEEVIKQHPDVLDAAVVGVPDERFGQVVTALVEVVPQASFDPDAVIAHVRTKLAAYKAPKQVHDVGSLGRAPNGKLDYPALAAVARERLEAGTR